MNLYSIVWNRYTALLLLIVALQVSEQLERVLIMLLSLWNKRRIKPSLMLCLCDSISPKFCTYFSADGLTVSTQETLEKSI